MSEYRVGMCSRCNERVWLTTGGACSRGHGTGALTAVEDVAAPATSLPKTVFCRSCGSELFETVDVCGNCGTSQSGAGAGATSAPGSSAGQRPGSDFSSQQWTVGGSVIGVSASSTPPLTAAPDFSIMDPYYQDEFRRIYESGEVYKGKWNWAAFLFGPFWMLARDMPLTGLIALGITLLFGGATGGSGIPAIGIAYQVYLGIRGNYLRYTALYKRVQTFIE